MLRQFLVGGGVSVCNIAIHALMMTTIILTARAIAAKNTLHSSLLLIGVMTSTVFVLMITHTLEVIVWSVAYLIVDIAPLGAGLVYFAFVNYTTLGSCNSKPQQRDLTLVLRRLVEPAAQNGHLFALPNVRFSNRPV